MDVRRAKRALRREARDRILALDPAERSRQVGARQARVPYLPGFAAAGLVLLYAPAFPEEIDTRPLLDLALEAGKRLALPRVDQAARAMTLHEVADPATDLRPGTLGIPEPGPSCPEFRADRIDWVLAPGLAFDGQCYRLGRGAGHYDRLLGRLRPGVPCWALALDAQWLEHLPIEPHDRSLDGVAFPTRMVAHRPTPGCG